MFGPRELVKKDNITLKQHVKPTQNFEKKQLDAFPSQGVPLNHGDQKNNN